MLGDRFLVAKMTFFSFSSETSRYKLAGQLKGHTDSVHCVALTKGGNILASGGELLCHPITNTKIHSG